jgi:hypothetical protein
MHLVVAIATDDRKVRFSCPMTANRIGETNGAHEFRVAQVRLSAFRAAKDCSHQDDWRAPIRLFITVQNLDTNPGRASLGFRELVAARAVVALDYAGHLQFNASLEGGQQVAQGCNVMPETMAIDSTMRGNT